MATLTFDRRRWSPPERLTLSEWAQKHYYLSAESSAEPGRFRPYKYQIGIMNAVTDPAIHKVSFIKSARVGATKIINAIVGYYMHQDPCPLLVVQPTVEDAEGYSKEEIAPMLRDCPTLAELFGHGGQAKQAQNTILHKLYPGGSVSMVGANSGRGFRRVSRKVVLFDEVDGYPASAGPDGDQIKLGERRAEHYWDRKIFLASTPLVAGNSRILEAFEQGDQRRFFVPCPHCGHFDFLAFRQKESGGHWMRWPKGEPRKAHFICSDCGCEISHEQKRDMVNAGEWRASKPLDGHASFHIWAAYSFSPNASWGQLAKEFDECNDAGPEKLKTFVNTVLGETWVERGDAPEYERLMSRRETYPLGSVPAGVMLLTCGVDVQKDRLVYEVVGWGKRRESWSVDSGVLLGDTSGTEVWEALDCLLARSYPGVHGEMAISMMAVDSGYNTQTVYNWCRRHPMNRVIAVKGSATAKTMIGSPSQVDVTVRGKRIGYKVFTVGSNLGKSELYGWLRLQAKDGEPAPPGYCHFPEYGEDYFRQLTAEHLVTRRDRKGFTVMAWEVIPGRENHFLDCRVYARAAASLLGVDRMRDDSQKVNAAKKAAPKAAPNEPPPTRAEVAPRRAKPKRPSGGFLKGGKGWIR